MSVENLPSDDVIQRVDLIVEQLVVDVERSIVSRAMLEASNRRVLRRLAGIQTTAAEGHANIQNSLRVTLCLELARVFDVSSNRAIHKQNKASLPILADYLAKEDVRQSLAARSGPHAAQCELEIDACLARWTAFKANPSDVAALERLRQLRDWRIAHTIFDKEPELPTYRGIFRLVNVAAIITCHAQGAVSRQKTDFKYVARAYRHAGNEFWDRFIEGTKAHSNVGRD